MAERKTLFRPERERRYWFCKRAEGWGWEPASPKGCITTAVFLGGILVLVFLFKIEIVATWPLIVFGLGWFVAFIALALATSGPSRS